MAEDNNISELSIHLYEKEHKFIDGTTANLVPTEWNNLTVADGISLNHNLIDVLSARDVYLSEIIGSASYDLINKYQGSEFIIIDNEDWTINAYPGSGIYNFTSGVKLLPSQNNTLLIRNSTKDENKLILNSNSALSYNCTSGVIKNITTAYTTSDKAGGLTDDSDYKTLKKPDGTYPTLIYVSDFDVNTLTNYSYSSVNGSANVFSVTQTISSKGDTIYSTTYTDVVTNEPYDEKKTDTFTPSDRTVFNDTTKEGGLNYITDSVNMCPTGVLYIW